MASLIDKPRWATCRPVAPRRPGLLNPDAALVRGHGHVVRPGDDARRAGTRCADRDEKDVTGIGETCCTMAGYERDHAARHRRHLLHRGIRAERVAAGHGT